MSGPLDGVIFDLDGTLVDSQLDFAAMREETRCPPDTGLLEHIEQLEDEAERARAEAVIHRHELAGAEAASWMPGAAELLETLCSAGVPTGIVTRNSRPAATRTLELLAAPALDLVTREDAAPKPAPDGLLLLAGRWQLPPARLIYVGDFGYDLEAAANAGMRSALFLQFGNRHFAPLADHAFDRFDELARWLEAWLAQIAAGPGTTQSSTDSA